MTTANGARGWLSAHVEAAAWHALRLHPNPPTSRAASAVRETLAALRTEPATSGTDSGWQLWDEVGQGPGDWLRLLGTAEPAQLQCGHLGTAALLHAAADGLLGATLVRPRTVPELAADSGWPVSWVHAVAGFALEHGWLTGGDRVQASPALRALAGVGVLPEPSKWLADRLRFELKWFWCPLGQLPDALECGRPVARFGAPGHRAAFRAASVAVNLPAAALRKRMAGTVADRIGVADRPRRILDIGTGVGVWADALAVHPGSRVVAVDLPEVLALTTTAGRQDAPGEPAGPPPPGPFDIVVVNEVLHTVASESAMDWLAEVSDRLAPGGILLVVDPLLDGSRSAPRTNLAVQVKLAITGVGRVWDGPSLVAALRSFGLRTSSPRTVGGAELVLGRRRPARSGAARRGS